MQVKTKTTKNFTNFKIVMTEQQKQTAKPLTSSEEMRKQINQSEEAGDKKFIPASTEDVDEKNEDKES